MKYDLNVSVEQKHIDKGTRHKCRICPIALAINDCLKENYHAAIGQQRSDITSIEYSDRNITQYMVQSPKSVIKFMNDFDGSLNVLPFTFTLPEVDERYIKWV